ADEEGLDQRLALGAGQPRADHRGAACGHHQRPGADGGGDGAAAAGGDGGRRAPGGRQGEAGYDLLSPAGAERGGAVSMAWTVLRDERLQEQVYQARLDNGLGVFVMPKPGFHKKYAVFSTRYGSVDNRFRRPDRDEVIQVPDGIAHFLEHQLFQDASGHVFNAFADLGASVNAYTSYTMTSYLFSTTDNFPQAFDKLLDFVQAPHFTEAGVRKEIGIIEQEIRMYQDFPRHRLSQNLLQALYHVHPVRIDIAGTVESIREITADTLQLCYDTFYHPSNMAVLVVGDVEPDAVLQQVLDDMAGRRYSFRPPVQRLFDPEPE